MGHFDIMWQGIAYGLAAGALWGFIFLAPQLLSAFSALELSAARYLLYGAISLCLLVPLWPRLRHKVTRADWIALFWLSLAGNTIYYLFVAGAVQWAGIAPASLIVGVLPVTVTLIGSRDHGAVPLRKLAWPLLLVGLGILSVNLDVFMHAGSNAHGWGIKLLGIVCAVGALTCWTVYAVGNARYLARNGHFSSHEWSVLTGVVTGLQALLLAVPAFLPPLMGFGPAAGGDWRLFWLVCMAVAVGASTIGNAFWHAASRRLPLTLSGQMIVFETFFALCYGFLFEARWPRGLELVAIVSLLAGVSWSVRLHAPARKA